MVIYISGVILISGLTIFLIVKNVQRGISLYFQERHNPEIKLPFQDKEIDKLIEYLRKYKFIE